ncbi:histidine phosphatase superfamily [Collybia nuda]|uniref:Histidine phosphatase superfamily n=1 Tax=Collybia nuda TaxID=64659 RepID=A0A9P5YFM9_9AGAR|nr:histidine phosphatase superfamily [Collybia nuda]
MITVTFIRHGESEDNTRGIWAGWKDAPLSELGQKQAQAVGKAFSEIKLDHVYASPLLRALATGQAVHSGQAHKPPFTVNPKLREQHFGIAEGHPWVSSPLPANMSMEELFSKNVFPVLEARDAKFPEGESLEDLARRAEEAVRECIIPHIKEDGAHIALASHGLCISELIAAIIRLDPDSSRDVSYTGLLNTAWTRLTISLKDEHPGPIDPTHPPALVVRVTDVNNSKHLASIKVPPRIIQDAKQAEALAYFGGGLKPEGISITNAEVVTSE